MSSIREGRPLTGRDGALTPLIKKLLEARLEIYQMRMKKFKDTDSFEIEMVVLSSKKEADYPELKAKVLSTFASGMGYRDIASHVEEIYDHKISVAVALLTNCYQ